MLLKKKIQAHFERKKLIKERAEGLDRLKNKRTYTEKEREEQFERIEQSLRNIRKQKEGLKVSSSGESESSSSSSKEEEQPKETAA